MDAAGARLQENGFLLCQAPVDDSHCELAVEVGKTADAPDEKVDILFFCVVGQQTTTEGGGGGWWWVVGARATTKDNFISDDLANIENTSN